MAIAVIDRLEVVEVAVQDRPGCAAPRAPGQALLHLFEHSATIPQVRQGVLVGEHGQRLLSRARLRDIQELRDETCVLPRLVLDRGKGVLHPDGGPVSVHEALVPGDRLDTAAVQEIPHLQVHATIALMSQRCDAGAEQRLLVATQHPAQRTVDLQERATTGDQRHPDRCRPHRRPEPLLTVLKFYLSPHLGIHIAKAHDAHEPSRGIPHRTRGGMHPQPLPIAPAHPELPGRVRTLLCAAIERRADYRLVVLRHEVADGVPDRFAAVPTERRRHGRGRPLDHT